MYSVAGNSCNCRCSISAELPSVSPGLLPHRRNFMSKYSISHRHVLYPSYRPFQVGVASRLATAIYVAMVTPILCDNSYSLYDSNLKYESYRPYG